MACVDTSVPELIPVRMLNEYAYCPRLCWIEWVEGEFAGSSDTADGKFQHRRVDRESGNIALPADPGGAGGPGGGLQEMAVDDPVLTQARSVMMSAPELGMVAKMDLVEEQGGIAVPVDVKRGTAPNLPEGAYEPERVQVCAQALILRENGYRCDHAEIYFAQSRRRVTIPVDDALAARTLELLAQMRAMGVSGAKPRPLDDSPKCPRCSLAGVCLPDETNSLLTGDLPAEEDHVRRLTPARDDALPLYIQKQGAVLGKSADKLTVKLAGALQQEARMFETSQVCVFGGVQLTTPAIQECFSRDIPVLFFSYGGWFYGMAHSLGHKNIGLRQAQYRAADNPGQCLAFARDLVRVKILNSRTMLRRNHPNAPTHALDNLKQYADRTESAMSLESLLGIEGMAAKVYFTNFGALLKNAVPVAPSVPEEALEDRASYGQEAKEGFDFSFEHRNRRPPRDPVNAMLSFAYALFTKDWTITLAAVGLDPYLGVYHQPRYGRPALALDMMEPFRPLVPDSVVLWAVNNGVVGPQDFLRRAGGVALKDDARRKFILAYEKRMDDLVTHPVFNYRISYRRILEVQARLFARVLTGEIDRLPDFLTR